MSTVSSDLYSSLGLTGPSTTKTSESSSSLNQADFLRLMTEQLQHQDPLKPMDNSQMVSQMAQLSTVQGIGDLNKTVTALSESMNTDQILRGAALVGRKVLVPSASLPLNAEGNANGLVAAPSAGIVNLTVTDANGVAVKQISVTAGKAGETNFSWDGTDANGNRLPAGNYTVAAVHTDGSGTDTKLSTFVQAPVESATLGSDTIYLDLTGLGTVPIADVLRIS